VGKTAVSLPVAEGLPAEIVNCDARQVYRGMDIGTAKPTAEERARVPHHCLDLVEPTVRFTAADYGREARRAVARCFERGLWALVVGGSGLYLRALVEGLFPGPAANGAIRERLRQEASREGSHVLHARLREVDPQAASSIHPNDLVRLIRALEVYEITGEPISRLQRQAASGPGLFRPVVVGLKRSAQELSDRIARRVEAMVAEGLAEEVRALRLKGLGPEHPAMQGIGYRQVAEYLDGALSLEEAVSSIVRETRKYAKRQMTWFRRLEGIEWIELTDDVEADARRVLDSLKRRLPTLPSPQWARIIQATISPAGGEP
jgi:tRNA dimethylallyltransferase